MQPDLSPHLHTVECNMLIDLLKRCNKDHPFKRYFGECSYWDEAVWQCTKKERIWRRDHNPKYGKRYAELKHLPFEYYTPVLKKMKEEGKLNTEGLSGCQI
uniref:COX assembly mitochondrial protein n=1 Tax=Panagrolaimus sp. PS1159 TaxID=55785 RepID=A0AC35G4Z3_9BILA